MGNDTSLFGKEKIIIKGLELKPITMKHYDEWLRALPVLTLRMSTLPAKYAVMPFFGAIYALEIDGILAGEQLGMFEPFCSILCLSLGIPRERMESAIELATDKDDYSKLTHIIVHTDSMAEPTILKPFELNGIREAIAELNGAELPDENENPELVEALQVKNEMQGCRLEPRAIDAVDAVALASGLRVKDILPWTIREFEIRKDSVNRAKYFTVNAIAEGNGATWKGGNPVPDWLFKKAKDTNGFTPVSSLMGKLGSSEAWLEEQMELKQSK